MLPSKEQDQAIAIIPPKLRLIFSNFNPLFKAHNYQVFIAVSRSNNQNYTIRVLDLNTEFYSKIMM